MMEDTDAVDVEPDPDDNATDYAGGYIPYNYYDDHLIHSLSEQKNVTKRFASIPNVCELNRDKAEAYYPIFLFLGVVLVVCLLCNLVVCYIYRCRSRRATSNFFVIFFAISDLVFCTLGTVSELLNLIMPYTYKVTMLCQLSAFLRSLLVTQLPLTLICVVYDCYRKVCRPNDEFGVKKAGFYCGISGGIAVLLSIPAFSVYGIIPVSTEHLDVKGTACGPDPSMPEWLNILHYVCMLSPFILSLVVMTIAYCMIALSYCADKQAEERGEKPSPLKREFPKKHTFVSKEDISSSSTSYCDERWIPSQTSSYKSTSNDASRVPLKGGIGVTVKKTNSMQATTNSNNAPIIPLHVKNTRQAIMFALISIFSIIFMLPLVVVSILSAATRVFETPLAYDTDLAFNFSVRLYLLNYLTKPVMYLICNVNFRKEVKHLLGRMLALCLRSSPPSPSEPPSNPPPPQRNVAPQSSMTSRSFLKRIDQRAKVEMSPMLQRAFDSQSSSSSVQKPRERWRWNQVN